MLELAILGLLKEHELHGYELKKRLSEVLGAVSSVSFGSLYPALARLERSGQVRTVEAGPAAGARPIPMTGSLTGESAALRQPRRPGRDRRGKKVYGITELGERRLQELLETDRPERDDERSFRVRLAFSRYLPSSRRLRLFERRRARLLERLEDARLALRDDAALDPYTRSLMEHETESTENDIAWLERLIAAEQAGGAS